MTRTRLPAASLAIPSTSAWPNESGKRLDHAYYASAFTTISVNSQ
jgi:hypothetical protein